MPKHQEFTSHQRLSTLRLIRQIRRFRANRKLKEQPVKETLQVIHSRLIRTYPDQQFILYHVPINGPTGGMIHDPELNVPALLLDALVNVVGQQRKNHES